MEIIIAGAGKVGFNLAKTLSIGHNVTVIDKNLDALQRIQESLDIMPYNGDVEDYRTYYAFADKKVDLFIAVTNIDNVNIISTLMIDTIVNVKRKFVRLQNMFFANDIILEKLNIDQIILPIKLASNAIVSVLNYPQVNNIKFFKNTDYKLISIKVNEELSPEYISEFKPYIIGIERGKRFFIPQTDESKVLYKDDLVYLFVREKDIDHVANTLGTGNTSNPEINTCVVAGGGDLGVSISKALLDTGKKVKIIEKDLHLCERADEVLQGKVSVVNSKYGSNDLFEDENLSNADIFIAATNNDEFNIIKCLEAKEKGIDKVVAINNDLEYYQLMHSLGMIVVRGPKISAYNNIMEHINSNGIVIQKSFCGAQGVAMMRKIYSNSRLIGKKIKMLKSQDTLQFYIREEKLYPLLESLVVRENDIIIAFSTTDNSPKVKQWIYELYKHF
jgi:trk system potassium uptake protein